MESWSFPPRFDPAYVPPAGSRYWFPKRETMPPAERERAILGRLQELTRYAWDRSPFYRRKWEEAGFHPDHLRTLEDFESKVPVIAKKDLREAQARVPPFGDYLCVPDADVFHIHGTSGTTGRPTAFAIGRDEWDAIMLGSDVCYAPVLTLVEAPKHPHNVARQTFVELDGIVQPAPAPRFSRTVPQVQGPPQGATNEASLKAWGFGDADVANLQSAGAI